MTTLLDLYRQSIEQMNEAFDALDQAVATLKDIGLEQIGERGLYHCSARGLLNRMEDTVKALEACDCDECGEPIEKHNESSACRYWMKPFRRSH